jgi:ferredoxin
LHSHDIDIGPGSPNDESRNVSNDSQEQLADPESLCKASDRYSFRRASGERGHGFGVRVWIDQDLCTGDGLCTDHCPDVFTLLEDGIAYVCEVGEVANDPGGPGSIVQVPEHLDAKVLIAADDCPGECIFIEIG